MSGAAVRHARLRSNPSLLVIRDSGNAYVLRRKLQGIHWEEAVEQLQGAPRLQGLNKSLSLDRSSLTTVRETAKWLLSGMERVEEPLMDHLAYFISWDLSGISLRSSWMVPVPTWRQYGWPRIFGPDKIREKARPVR